MAVSDTDLLRAWTQVLTLSKLKAGDAVTVLTSDHTHPQTLRCAITAASMLGALRQPAGPAAGQRGQGAQPRPAGLPGHHAAHRQPAGDRCAQGQRPGAGPDDLLFSPEQHEILQGGTKILLAVEPPEVLLRMVPTVADRDAREAGVALLKAGREMRVTSAAGTDLRCP